MSKTKLFFTVYIIAVVILIFGTVVISMSFSGCSLFFQTYESGNATLTLPYEGETVFQKKSTKRGICYNNLTGSEIKNFSKGLSWIYNWGGAPSQENQEAFDENGIEYVPMVWCSPRDNYGYDIINGYLDSHDNVKYILGHNEPNLIDQANEVPSETAENWHYIEEMAGSKIKMVSPAMNYGTLPEYGDPFKWMDEFFADDLVDEGKISAIACHSYMPSPEATTEFVEKFYDRYNKPVWLTEFACWEDNGFRLPSNRQGQIDFAVKTVSLLEKTEACQRYAFFMADASQEYEFPYISCIRHNGKSLSELGKVYTNMSSFDQELYYPENKWFPAEHYRDSTSLFKIKEADQGDNDNLVIADYGSGNYLKYGVNIKKGDSVLLVRHKTENCTLLISINDVVVQRVKLDVTGGEYIEQEIGFISPVEGNAILSVSVASGSTTLDAFAVGRDS